MGKYLANSDLNKIESIDPIEYIKVRKILVGKTLANGSHFAKFANIFPRRIIALYGNRCKIGAIPKSIIGNFQSIIDSGLLGE